MLIETTLYCFLCCTWDRVIFTANTVLFVKLIESFMAVFQLSPLCLVSSCLFALLIRSCFLCCIILISTIMHSFAFIGSGFSIFSDVEL